MAREINLVPDIKNEMLKTLKLRNLIFFLCIVVASASIGVTAIAGIIAAGQQAALTSKQTTLGNLSAKLNSYGDLNDFLTFQDQLSNISDLTNNKQVLSRTFNILSALMPDGADTITISELSVGLSGDSPTFSFDAQANAGKAPFIDYNVLDSFKKSMQYMRYDYGDYVDKNGTTIPAYCMIETGSDGAIFNDTERGIYALWTIDEAGCNPSATSNSLNTSTTQTNNSLVTDSNANTNNSTQSDNSYTREDYDGASVVRIWRTPQYNDWYKKDKVENQPYMDLNGQISGVPHFESSCISYTGTLTQTSDTPKWTETNDSCLLVPAGVEGIKISDSSNGRDSSGELVLRFAAVISLNPGVYAFTNHHVIALAPSGHHNVTDSFVQIQAMFGERANDCAEDDTACTTTTTTNSNANKKEGSN